MNKFLFFCFSAFFSGLLISHFYPGQFSFLSLSSCLIFFVLFLVFRKFKVFSYFFLCLAFLILGIFRFEASANHQSQLREYWGLNQTWDFWVCSDPEPAWNSQRAVLCFTQESWQGEKVLVNLPLYPRINYGDLLELKCRLEEPIIFPDFDYAAYLKAKGIDSVCSWPVVVSLKKDAVGNRFNKRLFQIKRQALGYLNKYLPEPTAGLASSLLLGYKKTLYITEAEALRQAGLSHLIAISGAHISLLLYLIINIFIYLGLYKQQALVPSYLLLCIYVLMTGLQASALRALIMGGLVLYAWYSARLQRTINLLIIAAMIILLINPLLWRDDLSFQLSFSALSGMIILQPIFTYYSEKYFSRVYQSFLKPAFNAFYLSFSAQLFIWPLIAVQLATVSLISPISNIFAFLIFCPLMISLLLALVLSFLGLASLITFWPAYVFLEYILILARKFSAYRYSHLDLPHFTWNQAYLYYLLLFLLIYIIKKNISKSSKSLSQ